MQRACDSCRERYEAKRPSSRFCSERCRKRAQRGHVVDLPAQHEAAVANGVPAPVGELHAATLAELTTADRQSTARGVAALALAARIDSGADTGSAVASLAVRWEALLASATAGASVKADPLDEFTARRHAKASGV